MIKHINLDFPNDDPDTTIHIHARGYYRSRVVPYLKDTIGVVRMVGADPSFIVDNLMFYFSRPYKIDHGVLEKNRPLFESVVRESLDEDDVNKDTYDYYNERFPWVEFDDYLRSLTSVYVKDLDSCKDYQYCSFIEDPFLRRLLPFNALCIIKLIKELMEDRSPTGPYIISKKSLYDHLDVMMIIHQPIFYRQCFGTIRGILPDFMQHVVEYYGGHFNIQVDLVD